MHTILLHFLFCVLLFTNPVISSLGPTCSFKFVEYLPSEFEKIWFANVRQWQSSEEIFCNAVKSMESTIKLWIENAKKIPKVSLADSPSPIFSRFKYERTCQNLPNKTAAVYTYIEPLAVFLLDPRAICLSENLFGQYHYVFASSRDPAGIMANTTGRVFLFDFGASTWDAEEGSSQEFLFNTYKFRGLNPSRMLLWEAKPMEPEKVFTAVPGEVLGAYQYFNVPAILTEGDRRNPLEILRNICQKDDFVVIKLDIGNGRVEKKFIQQILLDEQLISLVDEMFFAHQVNFPPMIPFWHGTVDQTATLQDSYHLFLSFRTKGIRFHGWY